MGVLASLLAPYHAAVAGDATTPRSLGMGAVPTTLAEMVGQVGSDVSHGAQAIAGQFDPNANRWERVAQQMAAKRGWGPDQFQLIDNIISRESGWDPNAVNPSSGAYGIPQILPAAHPDDLGLGPREQIRWLMDYIGNRYGSPQAAWDFKQQQGWY